MEYYPAAKVILNRKRDMNAWYTRTQETNLEIFNWWMWLLSWFDRRLYWLWRTRHLTMHGFYGGDFEGNGKAYAKAYYVDLEDYAKDHGRECLEWCVEDGW